MTKYELTETELCAIAFMQRQEAEFQQAVAKRRQELDSQLNKIYRETELRLGVEKLFNDDTGMARIEGRFLIKEEKQEQETVQESAASA
jgi:hypothetical protein